MSTTTYASTNTTTNQVTNTVVNENNIQKTAKVKEGDYTYIATLNKKTNIMRMETLKNNQVI